MFEKVGCLTSALQEVVPYQIHFSLRVLFFVPVLFFYTISTRVFRERWLRLGGGGAASSGWTCVGGGSSCSLSVVYAG